MFPKTPGLGRNGCPRNEKRGRRKGLWIKARCRTWFAVATATEISTLNHINVVRIQRSGANATRGETPLISTCQGRQPYSVRLKRQIEEGLNWSVSNLADRMRVELAHVIRFERTSRVES